MRGGVVSLVVNSSSQGKFDFGKKKVVCASKDIISRGIFKSTMRECELKIPNF